QLRDPRADRGRRGAAGGHPERQHHRFLEDRAGPHRLWRPRPDHGRATAALRPAGGRRAAAVLGHDPEKWEPVFGSRSCPNRESPPELPHLAANLGAAKCSKAASGSSPAGGRGVAVASVIARSDSDAPSPLAPQASQGWESVEARRAKAEAIQL